MTSSLLSFGWTSMIEWPSALQVWISCLQSKLKQLQDFWNSILRIHLSRWTEERHQKGITLWSSALNSPLCWHLSKLFHSRFALGLAFPLIYSREIVCLLWGSSIREYLLSYQQFIRISITRFEKHLVSVIMSSTILPLPSSIRSFVQWFLTLLVCWSLLGLQPVSLQKGFSQLSSPQAIGWLLKALKTSVCLLTDLTDSSAGKSTMSWRVSRVKWLFVDQPCRTLWIRWISLVRFHPDVIPFFGCPHWKCSTVSFRMFL